MDFLINGLKTEYLETPIGLDCKEPRFSWKMQSEKQGKSQSSYRLLVGTSPKGSDMWDSGEVKDSASHCVEYKGAELKPCTRYYFTVTVTDEAGEKASAESYFETGFLDSSARPWSGAKWIGAKKNNLSASAKGVFVIESDFKIVSGSTAGIVFGANDHRLTDKYKNTFLIEGENYISYVINISKIPASLEIYRVGYAPEDSKDVPLAVVEIPADVISEENKSGSHNLSVEVTGNCAVASIDGHRIDEIEKVLPFDKSIKVKTGRQLNPLGENDVITYPRLNEIGFNVPEGSTAVFERLAVSDLRVPNGVLVNETLDDTMMFGTLKKADGGFKVSGELITADPSRYSTPLLRKAVKTEKAVKDARLYVTARGVYEAYINGKRIGEDYFQPGNSQYDKHIYYQTYDITESIEKENAFAFYIASGWWSDSQTFTVNNHNYFGDRPSLIAKIVLSYSDGTTEEIITDESWKCCTEAPIRYASFFHGEYYDSRLETSIAPLFEAGFDDSELDNAIEIKAVPIDMPGGGPFKMWPSPNFTEPEFVGQLDKPIKEIMRIKAKSVTEAREGVYIYDMGQNMVGVPEIKINGNKGDVVIIRYAEILYPELPEYGKLVGLPLAENLRDAQCTDFFICNGGEQIIKPRFTFHGFRYIEITGAKTLPAAEDVTGIVISSITEQASSFNCSDELVSKLYENVLWSQRANFISIPTDCPQRNERMGWTGDAQVFAKTALYNADVRTLYYRYMQAMCDVQAENGRFADIAPVGGGFGGIVWGSAGIIVPFETYKQYGDKRILAENYNGMTKYAKYLTDNYKDGLLAPGVGMLGDWLAADMSTDNDLIFNAYYVYDMKLMAEIAEILGDAEGALNYKDFHQTARLDWINRFVNTDGKTLDIKGELNDTQCSYAVALDFDIPECELKEKMAANLNSKTIELGYTLTTGFVGTAPINLALTDNGYAETAFKLIRQREYPSWLYSVTQGATTIWERWNSYTVENGFGGNNSMNSFNHYSLGAVCAWLMRDVLGIRCEDASAYHSFTLKPSVEELDFANGSFESPYGKIESAWTRKPGKNTWAITIPSNTTAKVVLPVSAAEIDGVESGTEELILKGGKHTIAWSV